MESVNIAVIGRTLNSSKWDQLYESLDDGIEHGAISEYKKYSIDSMLTFPKADAYIYIATIPKNKENIYIHLQASASEDDIDDAVADLIKKIKGGCQSSSIDGDEKRCEFSGESRISGITIDINGKDITLDRQDFEDLREMLRLCDIYNFKIREVLTNE